MAQTVSGFYGEVTDVGESLRLHRVSPPLVWNSTDLNPTSTGTRTIRMAPGQIVVAGIHYIETANVDTVLPSNTSGKPRIDIVGLRFTWNPGVGGTVAAFSKQGTPASSPVRPSLTRNPGSVYEVPIAAVYVRSGVGTISSSDVYDCRVWSGRGGSYWMDDAKGLNYVDLPHGSYIRIGSQRYQVWTVDGAGNITTMLINTSASSWNSFTPNIYNTSHFFPLSASTTFKQGYHRIKDGACELKVNMGFGGSFSWTGSAYDFYLPEIPRIFESQYIPIAVHNLVDFPSMWIAGSLRIKKDSRWARIFVTAHGTLDFKMIEMNWTPSQIVIDSKYIV